MLIAAITKEGQEYCYKAKSAHKISKESGKTIVDMLNDKKIALKNGEKWHIYEIEKYDIAFDYAAGQRFYIMRGYLKRRGDRNLFDII